MILLIILILIIMNLLLLQSIWAGLLVFCFTYYQSQVGGGVELGGEGG